MFSVPKEYVNNLLSIISEWKIQNNSLKDIGWQILCESYEELPNNNNKKSFIKEPITQKGMSDEFLCATYTVFKRI